MKLKKLDRRMNGYGDFKHKVEYRKRIDRAKFIQIRAWCWEQWGPSSEYEFWDSDVNPAWCWIVDEWGMKILLASDKEAQWYILKWG
jgi:hypothetical protein